jgi:uncharacterized protein (TIGR02246 family)
LERETARTPADVDRLFAERVNAGDVDGVVALYEPEGVLLSVDGPHSRGHDAIRARIRQLVEMEFEVACNVVAVHQAGDTAVLYNDWQSTRRGPCGERLASSGRALEVVRRQPGGSWLFTIDDPFGRGT